MRTKKTESNHDYATIHDLRLARDEIAVGAGEEAYVLGDIVLDADATERGPLLHVLLDHGAAGDAPAVGK